MLQFERRKEATGFHAWNIKRCGGEKAWQLSVSQSGYLQVISVGVIGSSAKWGGGRIKAVVERGECKWKERKSKKINV